MPAKMLTKKKKKGGNISKNNCKFKNNGKQSQVTTAVPLSRLEVQGTYLEKKKNLCFQKLPKKETE